MKELKILPIRDKLQTGRRGFQWKIFSIIAFAGVVIYFLSKHSEALAKINKMQKIGGLITFIITKLIAGNCIYYGTSFLVEHFQNHFLYLSFVF